MQLGSENVSTVLLFDQPNRPCKNQGEFFFTITGKRRFQTICRVQVSAAGTGTAFFTKSSNRSDNMLERKGSREQRHHGAQSNIVPTSPNGMGGLTVETS